MFLANTHNSSIISYKNVTQHIIKTIKTNNTQLAYLGLKPKSSHTIKVLSAT